MMKNDEIFAIKMELLALEASFFDDFTFAPLSLASDYFRDGDMGYSIGISDIDICLTDDLEAGQFDERTKTIYLNPACAHDKCVLLHEMIHAYEFLIWDSVPALREILTLSLYKKLSASFPRVHVYLHQVLNRKTFKEIASIGGIHGALFALKALDIDMRMGWKPGTTFGYISF